MARSKRGWRARDRAARAYASRAAALEAELARLRAELRRTTSAQRRAVRSEQRVRRQEEEFRVVLNAVPATKTALEEREHSISLLRATIESTADGILVVDTTGKARLLNERFLDMWQIPTAIAAAGDDERMIAFVLNQLSDPDAFQARIRELYAQPEQESMDVLEFWDGRVFERYSRPQRLDHEVIGRVWSFRDVTEQRRSAQELSEHAATQSFLAQVSSELAAALGFEETVRKVARLAVPRLADWCVVDFQGDGSRLRRVACAHRDPGKRKLLSRLPQSCPADSTSVPTRAAPPAPGDNRTDADPAAAATSTTEPSAIRDNRTAEQSAAKPDITTEQAATAGSPAGQGAAARTPAGQAATTRRPVGQPTRELRVVRVPEDGAFEAVAPSPESAALLEELGMRAFMRVPLVARDQVLGELVAVRTESPAEWTEREQAVAMEFGYRAALAVDNARLYETAVEASRAKSDFLAVMSHELRTPLNSIVGYAHLMQAGVPVALPPPHREHIERIQASTRHLTELIENVLTLSRLEAGREEVRSEHTDLTELTQEVAGLLEPAFKEKELRLELDLPSRPVRVDTDPGKVRQILLNLLSNAAKFTERGHAELSLRVAPSQVSVTVSDTGIGIAPGDLERIFEAFTQVERRTKRVRGGTGLGLSVSRHLARLLGGDLIAESEPGAGSRFELTMPAGSAVTEGGGDEGREDATEERG